MGQRTDIQQVVAVLSFWQGMADPPSFTSTSFPRKSEFKGVSGSRCQGRRLASRVREADGNAPVALVRQTGGSCCRHKHFVSRDEVLVLTSNRALPGEPRRPGSTGTAVVWMLNGS